ncbi:MAG: hypothetical protein KGI41_03120 [Patescibacteria group bacterium]|nr:hypothetical protein [Patescibacteria group bacterium]MDE1966206.1 hypothetical protein [Patescibacteria group bacterium]
MRFRLTGSVIIIGGLLILGGGTLLIYSLGYRLAPGPSIMKAYTLTVSGLPAGAVVYADSIRNTVAKDGLARLTLTPGNHAIIVEASGYWPWNELVPIRAQDASVPAIMVPVPKAGVVPGTLLSGAAADAAKKLVADAALPSSDAPLPLAGGCAKTYVSDNRIIADPVEGSASCTPPAYLCEASACSPTVIFSPVDTLRSVVPFPGRDDALLVAVGGSVYALELDPLDPRYFAPAYAGTAPALAARKDGSVVVEDKGAVYSLAL